MEQTDFAVPVFHAYGHKLDCQVLWICPDACLPKMFFYFCNYNMQIEFNPRNIPGFGLSDGEVLECMWSYLRRFSTMTKEMRPSHRIDILTDALRYYGRKSARNIGMCTPRSWKIKSLPNLIIVKTG